MNIMCLKVVPVLHTVIIVPFRPRRWVLGLGFYSMYWRYCNLFFRVIIA